MRPPLDPKLEAILVKCAGARYLDGYRMIGRAGKGLMAGNSAPRAAIEGVCMRKGFMVPAVLALAAALSLGACVSSWDGKTYGQITWSSSDNIYVNGDFSSTSGFPYSSDNLETGSYKSAYSSIYDGSYHFVYYLNNGASYSDPFLVSYTVQSNDGTKENPAKDKYFSVSCGWTTGASITEWTSYNASKSASKALAQADGEPVTIQGDGYTVTMTVKKVTLSDAEKASFISLGEKSE